MHKIHIDVKIQAKEKDILNSIIDDRDSKILIDIQEEEQSKEPVISKAIEPNAIQPVMEAVKGLLTADSIVHILVDSIFPLILLSGYSKSKEFLKFILSNNRKKGNKIGVKITLEKEINEKKYIYDFICDDIPEVELSDALSKANTTVDDLNITLGEDYFIKIKRVVFMYKIGLGWKPEAIEKIEENNK